MSSVERPESPLNPIALTQSEIYWRKFWRRVFSIPIRNSIVAGRENLDDAARYVGDTGNGVAVEFVHFGQTDPMHAMLSVTSHQGFRHSRIVAPFAYHHVPRRFPLFKISESMGVELFPVVTENTISWAKRKGIEGLEVGQGVEECMDRTAQVLAGGGISISAPQGERRPYLNHWEVEEDKDRKGHPNMAAFDIAMRMRGVKDYGIIFLAFEIPGYFDYNKLNKFNIEKRPFLARYGKFNTRESAVRQAGRARNLDGWGFQQAASVCPPSYVRK